MFLNLFSTWIRGLLSIGLLVAGGILVKEWVDELPTHYRWTNALTGTEEARPLATFGERVDAWDPGFNRPTGFLIAGVLLLSVSFFGRFVSPWLWRKGGAPAGSGLDPRVEQLKTRNGYVLNVDIHGRREAPALVLVHGVGSDRTQWNEAVEDLSDRFCVYAYDLLGHGKSDHVAQAEHTIEAAARDLDDVLALTGTGKVVLAGHSMGGMIVMTWCSTHPDRLSRLAGLVLVHTTPQNPFETMAPVPLHRRLQKLVHEPTLRLTPPLAPVVRVMNALDYLNGTTHWSNDRAMYGGSESRGQLEHSARLHARMDPAAVARFTLSMARFDARPILAKLDVPTIVVAADKDGVTIPEASRFIVKRIPRAELMVLEGTRHMGFMERRLEFAEAISGLLDLANVAESKRRSRRAG